MMNQTTNCAKTRSESDEGLSATAWSVIIILALAIFVAIGIMINIAFPQNPQQQAAHDKIVSFFHDL
ncbi:MAG TPA: hypothetical protein VIJ29_01315 [Candidatus Paceibacterota bacterium]